VIHVCVCVCRMKSVCKRALQTIPYTAQECAVFVCIICMCMCVCVDECGIACGKHLGRGSNDFADHGLHKRSNHFRRFDGCLVHWRGLEHLIDGGSDQGFCGSTCCIANEKAGCGVCLCILNAPGSRVCVCVCGCGDIMIKTGRTRGDA
jgi:hypothetical protein